MKQTKFIISLLPRPGQIGSPAIHLLEDTGSLAIITYWAHNHFILELAMLAPYQMNKVQEEHDQCHRCMCPGLIHDDREGGRAISETDGGRRDSSDFLLS